MKYMLIGCMALSLLFATNAEKGIADTFDETYSRFKADFSMHDYFKAHAELHHLLEHFWEKTPLLLRNVRFVRGEDNSYGIYDSRDGNSFAAGEPLYLYLEPVGYAFKKNPKGYYEFGFKADFTLEDDKGNELGGQKGFANLNFSSWNYNTEVSVTFTYTFTGFEKGKYKVITHVMDANSNKNATVEKWFYIK